MRSASLADSRSFHCPLFTPLKNSSWNFSFHPGDRNLAIRVWLSDFWRANSMQTCFFDLFWSWHVLNNTILSLLACTSCTEIECQGREPQMWQFKSLRFEGYAPNLAHVLPTCYPAILLSRFKNRSGYWDDWDLWSACSTPLLTSIFWPCTCFNPLKPCKPCRYHIAYDNRHEARFQKHSKDNDHLNHLIWLVEVCLSTSMTN